MEHTPEAPEIGCSINLVTGEHYGPCRGSCGPDEAWEALAQFMGCTDEEAKTMLAAPALLEALEALIPLGDVHQKDRWAADFDAACAVIQKAKGD